VQLDVFTVGVQLPLPLSSDVLNCAGVSVGQLGLLLPPGVTVVTVPLDVGVSLHAELFELPELHAATNANSANTIASLVIENPFLLLSRHAS